MSRTLRPDEERLWRALTERVAPVDHGRARKLKADEQRLWQAVMGVAPRLVADQPQKPAAAPAAHVERSAPPPAPLKGRRAPGPAEPIEPGRRRRLALGREPIQARIDLHGLDQDRAKAALDRFVRWAHAEGYRAVLVITGKGPHGDGVLRRRTPEWLTGPELRPLVAGFSRAEQRHGGEGALYVVLKRRT